jgi:hypothetical protein
MTIMAPSARQALPEPHEQRFFEHSLWKTRMKSGEKCFSTA